MLNRLAPKRDWTFDRKAMEKMAEISLGGPRNMLGGAGTQYGTKDAVRRIIAGGDLAALRAMSNHFWNTSGIYRRMILYYSSMLTYDHFLSPSIVNLQGVNNQELHSDYTEALVFLRNLKIKLEFPKIVFHMIRDGAYFGFLREGDDGAWLIQDLPIDYCRTRFKTLAGLNAIEFDVRMFDRIMVEADRQLTLKQFPKEIQKGYAAYLAGTVDDHWILLPVDQGVCFYYPEMKPWFLSTLPELVSLDEYRDLELQKDRNETMFLLNSKLPINRDGELIFDLPEAAAIHAGTVAMLRGIPSVHTLTSFSDVEIHGLQNPRQSSKDNLMKAERNPFIETGMSREIFAGEGSVALAQSIKKDEALIINMLPIFNVWLTHQINLRFGKKDYFFLVSFLPLTHYNRDTVAKTYLKGAEYGYSKLLPAIASGISQDALMGLMFLESQILGLESAMIPLKSTHTSAATSEDAGRPEREIVDKADKTLENEDNAR